MSDTPPPPPPASPPPPSPTTPTPGSPPPLGYEAPNATAGVARTASLFLKIAAVLGAVQALLRLLTTVLPGSITGAAIGGIIGCLSLLILLGMVAGMVIYLVWQYRAYEVVRNAGQSTTYTPGWSVAWLVIPFANLIFSKTVWLDLWRASGAIESPSPLAAAEKPAGGRPMFIYFCFIGFFALFLIGILFALIALAAGAFVAVIAGLLSVVAYLLWVGFTFGLSLYVDDVQRALPASPAASAAPVAPPAQ